MAMILVAGWFVVVAVAAFAYGRSRAGLMRPMLATVGAIAVATIAIGYWTGFRKTEFSEPVAMAATRAPEGQRTDALAPEPEGKGSRETPGAKEMTEAVELASSDIAGADGHSASGSATLVDQPDAGRILTLTGFDSDPGPDVDVYLSSSSAGVDDAIRLGDLKGSGGTQQYEIPANADLNRYDALVLWCIPFTTRIATAELR